MRTFKDFVERARDHRRHAHPEGHCAGPGFRHGGRGGRLGRFLEHGDLRLLVLHLVEQSPRHGYDLIKAIEDLTGGAYAPSPGVIYPTLTLLEETGLAVATTDGTKRLYTITDDGRAELTRNKPGIDALLARMAIATPRTDSMPVARAMENLKTALRLKLGGRTISAEAVRAISAAIDDTARKIEEL